MKGTASVWVQVLVGILAVTGSAVAAWLAGRASTRAAAVTAKVQNAAVVVDREGQFMDGLLNRLASVEKQATECQSENELLREQVNELRNSMSRLTRAQQDDRHQIALGALYMTQLRTTIAEMGKEPPPPPFGLVLKPVQ